MVVRACVIGGYGINADCELRDAFAMAGSEAARVHVQDLLDRPSEIDRYHILAFPGGFSFGDHLGSGRVLAALFKRHLKEALDRFVSSGRLVIGVCNGFQVLVKMGILPNLRGGWTPEVSLIHNDTGLFEDSWVRLSFNRASPCLWTRGLAEAELPIRHGEGRFIVGSEEIMRRMEESGLVALRYEGRNPNGSLGAVAGITDPSGRILGLMPHPEAFLRPEQHPRWARERFEEGQGLALFRNGVEAVRRNL